jgi:hypothetical protein
MSSLPLVWLPSPPRFTEATRASSTDWDTCSPSKVTLEERDQTLLHSESLLLARRLQVIFLPGASVVRHKARERHFPIGNVVIDSFRRQ